MAKSIFIVRKVDLYSIKAKACIFIDNSVGHVFVTHVLQLQG